MRGTGGLGAENVKQIRKQIKICFAGLVVPKPFDFRFGLGREIVSRSNVGVSTILSCRLPQMAHSIIIPIRLSTIDHDRVVTEQHKSAQVRERCASLYRHAFSGGGHSDEFKFLDDACSQHYSTPPHKFSTKYTSSPDLYGAHNNDVPEPYMSRRTPDTKRLVGSVPA